MRATAQTRSREVGAVVPACLGTGRRRLRSSERLGCQYLLSRVPPPALQPLRKMMANSDSRVKAPTGRRKGGAGDPPRALTPV